MIFGVLAGYYGFGNAGDEMLLERLLQAAPEVNWVVLSHRPGVTASQTGRPSVSRWNFLAMIPLFRRSRWLVFGGGELFQTRTSVRSFLYYLFLGYWARLWGCRLTAVGMGIDPALPAWGRRWVRRLFSQSAFLTVRDEGTARLLDGIPERTAVRRMPDPVWAHPGKEGAESSRLDRVLWILRFSPFEERETHEWSHFLNTLQGRTGWGMGFMAFHPQRDMPVLSRIRSRLAFFHVWEPWENSEELFSVMSRYDVVVSMRYHGIVAASLCRRACVALADHGKVTELMHALNIPGVRRNEMSEDAMGDTIQRAWDKRKMERGGAVVQWGVEAQRGLEHWTSWLRDSSKNATSVTGG